MTPEQIVRALAAADPTAYDDAEERFACTVCGNYKRERGYLELEDHAADCPWRLAVEWRDAADSEIGERLRPKGSGRTIQGSREFCEEYGPAWLAARELYERERVAKQQRDRGR